MLVVLTEIQLFFSSERWRDFYSERINLTYRSWQEKLIKIHKLARIKLIPVCNQLSS